MVGSGATDRSKEAVGMMALHDSLRTVCLNSDWTYSVFWTIRPRPRVRGGNGCKPGDENGSLMLMWEDGFCRNRVTECLNEIDGEDPVRKAFSKMSIQLYNYGEGLMGKVASDKCHKWAFKEPTECEPNISDYWQSSFDALPTEWIEQFESGIQTIAVIQAGRGLLQLGSCKIIPEDLHFVLRMRHTFESLGYQSGFYLSQLFSSTRNSSSSSMVPLEQPVMPIRPSPLVFNLGQRPLSPAVSMLTSPNFQKMAEAGIPFSGDETHPFLLPCSSDMRGDRDNDIKWSNGLTFFGQTDEDKLLFNPEGFGNKHEHQNPNSDSLSLQNNGNHPKMDNNFEGGLALPARMATSSSTSLDHHAQNPEEYRNEAGMYSDVMETFLE